MMLPVLSRNTRLHPFITILLIITLTFSFSATPLPASAALASHSDRIASFLSWLTSHNTTLKSVTITPTQTRGLSLTATSPLTPGQTFLSLPFSTLLSIEHVFQTQWAQQHLDPLSDTEAMAVFVAKLRKEAVEGVGMKEKETKDVTAVDSATAGTKAAPSSLPTHINQSTWNPWALLLPSSFPSSPLFWSPSQLAELQSSTTRLYISRRITRAITTYAALPDIVTEYLTFDDFLYGLSILWSRSHGIKAKDAQGKWHKAACFVPVADIINTASPSGDSATGGTGETNNVECLTNSASTHFECHALRAISTGEELLVTYGAQDKSPGAASPAPGALTSLSNGQLLLDYGFVVDWNKHDVVSVVLQGLNTTETSSSTILSKLRVSLFSSSQLGKSLPTFSNSPNHTFILPYPHLSSASPEASTSIGLIQSELRMYVRLLVLDEKCMKELGGTTGAVEKKWKQDTRLTLKNELKAMKVLKSAILEMIQSYGTSMKEDEEILTEIQKKIKELEEMNGNVNGSDQDVTGRAEYDAILARKAAVTLRMGEKRILHIYANLVEQYYRELKKQSGGDEKLHTEL